MSAMNDTNNTSDVSIVIVNWNTNELTRACLRSIRTYCRELNPEIILIDNASSDGSVAAIEQEFPDEIKSNTLTLIQNNTNNGFAAAVNQGIKCATSPTVLLLNPDTYFIDNSLTHMIEFMRKNPKTGILGPRISYPDNTLQPSCRHFPTFASQALILLKLHNLFPNLAPLRHYFMPDFDYKTTQQVDQVMGAVFLIRRELIDQIGLFDEQFFIWFEEVDYCKRAKDAGWEVTYFADTADPADAANAGIVHYKGKSFAQVETPRKQRYSNRSLIHYMHKHASIAATVGIIALYPLSMALSYLVSAFHLAKPDKNL
jgi:GT2 family glycosyltransferase